MRGRRSAIVASAPEMAVTAAVGLVLVFLYLPAVIIAVYAFNTDSVMSWPPSPGSLQWFRTALSDPDMIGGLQNSLLVALASTAIALLIGVPAGFAFDRLQFPGRVVLERILMLPFFLPGAISGLALLTVFVDLHVQLSLLTVIVGHATMLVAVFVILMLVGLARWDRSLEAASRDLGANEVRTFLFVVLPNFRNSIIGGVLLSITISLDEVARTYLLTGTQNTLPMVVWSRVHRSLTPEINAIATLMLGGSLLILLAFGLLARERTVQR